ncbi:hypothetical protein HDK64DRAFT_312587 [Phyllosticta capitalensis]
MGHGKKSKKSMAQQKLREDPKSPSKKPRHDPEDPSEEPPSKIDRLIELMDNLNESSRANLAHFKGMNSRIDVTLDRTRAVEQGLVEVADLVKKANAPPTPLSREDIVAWNTSRMPPPPTPLEREEETASRKDSLMPPPSLPNKGPPRGYFSNAPWRTLVQFEILETLASIWNPERWGFGLQVHLYHLLHSEHQHHCPWLPKYDAPKYSLSPDVELFYELKKIIMAYRTFYKKLLVLRAELELAIFALMDRPGMVEVEANNTDEDRELTSSLLRALLGGTNFNVLCPQ